MSSLCTASAMSVGRLLRCTLDLASLYVEMPVERAVSRGTPAGRQRVRTGCMKCRKRRRKCDERKPRCENCEAKGFSCEYRIDLSFVRSSSQASPGVDGGSEDRAIQTYSSIKFIINNDVATSTPRGSSTELRASPSSHAAILETRTEPAPAHRSPVETQSHHVSTPRQSNTALTAFDLISRPIGTPPRADAQRGIAVANSFDEAAPRPRQTSKSNDPLRILHTTTLKGVDDLPELGIITHETCLLRHYRYNIAPWIDVGDPESYFGTTVLLEAKEHASIIKAILALAECHMAFTFPKTTSNIDRGQRYAIEAEDLSRMAEDHICHLTSTLIMIRDLLSSTLQNWRDILSRHLRYTTIILSAMRVKGSLDEPIFWLHFRVDLATSVIASLPPLLPFPPTPQIYKSPNNMLGLQELPKSPKEAFQHAILLLARCLSLVFGSGNLHFSGIGIGHGALSPGSSISSSEWSLLWTDCLQWYQNRPVELQQIVDIRGAEVDQIDAHRESCFPILIYTTPLALVANATYHVASFLVLTHKPRLLKLAAGPRSFLSTMWHSQSIAGIASAVDSPDQWDPVLIAGLVLIARDLTHKAQQSTVLDILSRISATTGMNMSHEIEQLRSSWSIADYDGEIIE